jgi:hypothetical protein
VHESFSLLMTKILTPEASISSMRPRVRVNSALERNNLTPKSIPCCASRVAINWCCRVSASFPLRICGCQIYFRNFCQLVVVRLIYFVFFTSF